ncbi:HK97 family phage prohead protease [Rhodoligotrophos appendicifer]|uniref:HK97 family phage prohead protease n=1 Tax=Rhodoligotrophos appendicifer TaxID=987056 RepID=UPI0011846C6A|nr:HK97 family phage prohead protease [Rhodoligotrophos appendicifer]
MNRLEFKADLSTDDAGAITGLAWPFGSADHIGDMIEKGAFTGPAKIPMLFGHDPKQPIGVWESATETNTGLEVRGRLLVDDVARAREVHALVKAGALSGLSIGFRTKKAITRKGGGRTIQLLELAEISLVTIPMHPGAKVTSAKSAEAAIAIAEAINRAAMALRA